MRPCGRFRRLTRRSTASAHEESTVSMAVVTGAAAMAMGLHFMVSDFACQGAYEFFMQKNRTQWQ